MVSQSLSLYGFIFRFIADNLLKTVYGSVIYQTTLYTLQFKFMHGHAYRLVYKQKCPSLTFKASMIVSFTYFCHIYSMIIHCTKVTSKLLSSVRHACNSSIVQSPPFSLLMHVKNKDCSNYQCTVNDKLSCFLQIFHKT